MPSVVVAAFVAFELEEQLVACEDKPMVTMELAALAVGLHHNGVVQVESAAKRHCVGEMVVDFVYKSEVFELEGWALLDLLELVL